MVVVIWFICLFLAVGLFILFKMEKSIHMNKTDYWGKRTESTRQTIYFLSSMVFTALTALFTLIMWIVYPITAIISGVLIVVVLIMTLVYYGNITIKESKKYKNSKK